MSSVTVELPRDGGAARVRLCRARKANALDPEMVQQLSAAVDSAVESGARVLMIESELDVFSAGVDLGFARTDADIAYHFTALSRLLNRLSEVPAVTVAVVEGPAYGAGADIVMSCDFRLAGEGAKLKFPGAQFGVVLGQRSVTGKVDRATLLETVLLGRELDADTGLSAGFFTHRLDRPGRERFVAELIEGTHRLTASTVTGVLGAVREPRDSRELEDLVDSLVLPGLSRRAHDYLSAQRSR